MLVYFRSTKPTIFYIFRISGFLICQPVEFYTFIMRINIVTSSVLLLIKIPVVIWKGKRSTVGTDAKRPNVKYNLLREYLFIFFFIDIFFQVNKREWFFFSIVYSTRRCIKNKNISYSVNRNENLQKQTVFFFFAL